MLHRPLAFILLTLLALKASPLLYDGKILYDIQGHDDNALACINKSIGAIEKRTCLKFVENLTVQDYNQKVVLHFIISPIPTECAYHQQNHTIILDTKCVNDERCLQLLHRAIYGERETISTIFTSLNEKFGCLDKCGMRCENGANVTSDGPNCKCKCNYGFDGPNCENLMQSKPFTDPNCGIVNVSATHLNSGMIELTIPVNDHTFCRWALKSDDPWDSFVVEFDHLGLSDVEVDEKWSPCGDRLRIYGVKGLERPIACVNGKETEYSGKKYESDGNLVFIEFHGNSMDFHRKDIKGPVIKYTIKHTPLKEVPIETYKALRSEGSTSGASFGSAAGLGALLGSFLAFWLQRFY